MADSSSRSRLDAGIAVIADALRLLPTTPGVYRMIDAKGDVLYVGKAKNLRRRVANYTHPNRQPVRILRMVSQTATMEFVSAPTEAEALLLEANLIKRFKPRYNILLRDDKSFPSILITGDHPFPQIVKHRGARNRKGEYFGPFASAWAVNETLTVLQRAFLLRTCTDAVFAGRSRPCLLHQIKRCSAPCSERVDEAAYRALVEEARVFLHGDSARIQRDLATRMQAASDRLAFEEAAEYRDRIQALTRVQAHQEINLPGAETADVVAAHQEGGQTCVQVFMIRGGRNYGNRAHFPSHARDEDAAAVLEAFLGQFYAATPPPPTVLLSHAPPNQSLLAQALSLRAERQVRLTVPQRGAKAKLVAHAAANAREALVRRMAESATQRRLLEGLADALGLDGAPERVEVYDNSHLGGTNQVGAMIVAGPEGFMKNAYRKFTIREANEPGDDYAMMREVLTRRMTRAMKEDPDRELGQWPDLILIDGGRGHLNTVRDLFAEMGVENVALAAVSKGPDRNAGRERVHLPDRPPLDLNARDPVLYFIQRLRDEAHRFAIGTQRSRRGKQAIRSALDAVPGIGAKRKRALLHHFGSAAAVQAAARTDLEAVEGINRAIANKIYDWFHDGG